MGTVEYVRHSPAYLRTGIHCVPKNCLTVVQLVSNFELARVIAKQDCNTT